MTMDVRICQRLTMRQDYNLRLFTGNSVHTEQMSVRDMVSVSLACPIDLGMHEERVEVELSNHNRPPIVWIGLNPHPEYNREGIYRTIDEGFFGCTTYDGLGLF